MTTAIQEARARLDTYISECILRHEDLDVLKLRRLEDDLMMAARCAVTPF